MIPLGAPHDVRK